MVLRNESSNKSQAFGFWIIIYVIFHVALQKFLSTINKKVLFMYWGPLTAHNWALWTKIIWPAMLLDVSFIMCQQHPQYHFENIFCLFFVYIKKMIKKWCGLLAIKTKESQKYYLYIIILVCLFVCLFVCPSHFASAHILHPLLVTFPSTPAPPLKSLFY